MGEAPPTIQFRTPYPRPERLSDPQKDFEPTELQQILSTPDQEMGWYQYHCIFQAGLPAGTYQECAYFLPHVFSYLQQSEDVLNCLSDVIWFISEHSTELQRDGLLAPCGQGLAQCFRTWTRSFAVAEAGRSSQAESLSERLIIGLARCVLAVSAPFIRKPVFSADPVNSEMVLGTLEDLVRFKALSDLAEVLVRSLADQRDCPERSAWFLHCAAEITSGGRRVRHAGVRRLIENRNLVLYHAGLAYEGVVLPRADTSVPMRRWWWDAWKALDLGNQTSDSSLAKDKAGDEMNE